MACVTGIDKAAAESYRRKLFAGISIEENQWRSGTMRRSWLSAWRVQLSAAKCVACQWLMWLKWHRKQEECVCALARRRPINLAEKINEAEINPGCVMYFSGVKANILSCESWSINRKYMKK